MNLRKKTGPLGLPAMILAVVACVMGISLLVGSPKSAYDEAVTVQVKGRLIENDAGSGTKGIENFEFRVSQATTADGRIISNLKNQYLSFLDGKVVRTLVKRYRDGDELILKGNLKIKNRELDVKSFRKAVSAGSDTK